MEKYVSSEKKKQKPKRNDWNHWNSDEGGKRGDDKWCLVRMFCKDNEKWNENTFSSLFFVFVFVFYYIVKVNAQRKTNLFTLLLLYKIQADIHHGFNLNANR